MKELRGVMEGKCCWDGCECRDLPEYLAGVLVLTGLLATMSFFGVLTSIAGALLYDFGIFAGPPELLLSAGWAAIGMGLGGFSYVRAVSLLERKERARRDELLSARISEAVEKVKAARENQ